MGTDSIRPGRKGCCGIRASLLGRPASKMRLAAEVMIHIVDKEALYCT